MTPSAPLLATLLLAPAAGDDWPQWRGANFDGVAESADVPASWGEGGDGRVTWRTPLPGPGGGTPVVAGGRVFVTAADGSGEAAELVALAYDAASGNRLWRRAVSAGDATARGDEGNSASNSCVTDGARVWATFGDGSVACLTAEDGEAVWAMNLQDRFGRFDLQFGFHSTPVLHDGRLYFQLIHGDGDPGTGEARVVALDAATGATAWDRPRVTGAGVENEHSYASPVLNRFDSPPSLLTHGGDYTIAHGLAPGDDGAELWRLGGASGRFDRAVGRGLREGNPDFGRGGDPGCWRPRSDRGVISLPPAPRQHSDRHQCRERYQRRMESKNEHGRLRREGMSHRRRDRGKSSRTPESVPDAQSVRDAPLTLTPPGLPELPAPRRSSCVRRCGGSLRARGRRCWCAGSAARRRLFRTAPNPGPARCRGGT